MTDTKDQTNGYLETKISLLILQHPQEPDKELGTARLAKEALKNSVLKVGLSWPNLSKAIGHQADNKRWLVLYLGSAGLERPPGLTVVDKGGKPLPDSELIKRELDGVVILDGTWSQAKALWWRNPWLLKLRRGVLKPKQPSLYGALRKEPRRECLSTIEAIGSVLTELGEDPKIEEELRRLFLGLLEKFKKRPTASG
jgi:DTW domain-containing protein YfiP